MQLYPFSTTGKTVFVAVTATSQTVNVASDGTPKIPQQLLVQNLSSNVVYLAFGPNALIPVAGTPAYGLPIQPGVTVVYSSKGGDIGAGSIISLIASVAGPSNVTITPGEGS